MAVLDVMITNLENIVVFVHVFCNRLAFDFLVSTYVTLFYSYRNESLHGPKISQSSK